MTPVAGGLDLSPLPILVDKSRQLRPAQFAFGGSATPLA
jgi:hypothetical protein